jgi:hypothetical protein
MAGYKDLRQKMSKDSDIPESVVELPSGRQRATIRPMKVKEQRSVLKAIEKKDEYLINKAFDGILDHCVLTVDDEPFDNDSLIVQDRTYLLIKIQELTTGSISKISHINPKTEEIVNDVEVNISEFPVKYFDGELYKELQLSDSIFIEIGPVTRKDEKNIDNWVRKNKSQDSVIERRYCAYAAVIKSIYSYEDSEDEDEKVKNEYELTFDEKVKFITENCSNKELKIIDEFLKTLDFGIDLVFNFEDGDYNNPEEEANILSFFIN